MPPQIVKSGWVQRESSFLKRWKESWFVLYQNGNLKYFEAPNSAMAEGKVSMRNDCLYVKYGSQVVGVSPPANRTPECLLSLRLREEELNLCAQSPDDLRVWQIVLEESRVPRHPPQQAMATAPIGPPPAYSPAYTGLGVQPVPVHTYPAYPPQHVVYTEPARTQFVIQPAPVRRQVVVRAPVLACRRRRGRPFFW